MLNDEVRVALRVSDPVPLHVIPCLPCSTVSNTFLCLPYLEIDYAIKPTESAMIISNGVVSPSPGLCAPSRKDSWEDFVFGIDYTISFGRSTTAAPVIYFGSNDRRIELSVLTSSTRRLSPSR